MYSAQTIPFPAHTSAAESCQSILPSGRLTYGRGGPEETNSVFVSRWVVSLVGVSFGTDKEFSWRTGMGLALRIAP